jgi:hypothetical protein
MPTPELLADAVVIGAGVLVVGVIVAWTREAIRRAAEKWGR